MIQLGMGDGIALPGATQIDRNRTRIAKLIDKVETAWTEFHAAYAGLSDAELLIPGVTGAWSVRDLIAHVTWWDEEAITHLPIVLAGGTPPRYTTTYGGIDAFNALKTEEKRHLSLDTVRREGEDTHARLIAYLRSVPIEQLKGNSRFTHRLRLDTYGHYPIHAADITRWRQKRD
ncbi:MAG: DinB family protein [Chloroflexota bacterium]|nr:DinB family protein [Chloroflexota bacterium]